MGQSTQQEGVARQPSGDYAPYPPPVFDQARPGETPGVSLGAGWGTQVRGNPANPGAQPDNFASAARGFGSGSSSTGPAAAAPQPGQPVYVAQPAPQRKDTFGRLTSSMKGMASKGKELAGKISKYFSYGGSIAETMISRTSMWFKLLAEGGAFGLFKSTFDAAANEELLKTYACYLSTSTGPVAGTLYLSNLKFAFCSDRALSYSVAPGQQSQSFYKVMLPLEKVKAVDPSTNQTKPDEHYIQVETVDHHEVWFMGFVNYEKAVKNMREAMAKFHTYRAPAGPPSPSAYSHGGSFNRPQNSRPPPQGYPQNTGPPPRGHPGNTGSQPQGYQQP